ncbi:MAG: hypothetical protein ABI678_04675 [Kofleriaceae bacterium]
MAAGRSLLGLLVLACVSCAEAPDVCLTKQVSISSGVFGVIRMDCELGGGCDATHLGRPHANLEVGLFEPDATPRDGAIAIVTTTSGADGFFELSASPGNYNLCVISNSVCTVVAVQALALRYDYIPSMVNSTTSWEGLECVD